MDDSPESNCKYTQSDEAHLDGRTKSIGYERSLILDLLHFSIGVPSFPVERWFELGEVATARQAASSRISWITLFAKSYAMACKSVPELRRSYLAFPWPRFYQSRYSVISVAINRNLNGRDHLFFGRLRWPEDKTLLEIQSELDTCVHGDVNEQFRQQLRGSRVPLVFRRLAWWWRIHLAPSQRARRLGTGSISVLAGQGVLNRRHPCLLSSSLSYGPLEPDGRMWVTLQCDHRIIDGLAAARAINLMSDYLEGPILQELHALGRKVSAA